MSRDMKAFYVQHDNNARNDLKLSKAARLLMTKRGMKRRDAHARVYTDFFSLIEIMHEQLPMIDISDESIAYYIADQLQYGQESDDVEDMLANIGLYLQADLFDLATYEETGLLASRGFMSRKEIRDKQRERGRRGGSAPKKEKESA